MAMRRGDRIQVEITHEMMDQKGFASRFLVGTFVFEAASGKAFRASLKPGRRPATECFKCQRTLDRDDSRQVGYGPDCARQLGIRWPRKAELNATELADVERQLDQIAPVEIWLPYWDSVQVFTPDHTPIHHPVRPAAPTEMPPSAPERPYAGVDPRNAPNHPISLVGGAQRDYVPVNQISGQPTVTVPVGEPTDALDMLDRMLAQIAIKLPGYEPRPQQRLAMELIVRAISGESDYPDVIAEIGTGGGKSFILLLAHLAATYETNQPAILPTATKALQVQYRQDVANLQEWLAEVRPFTAAEIKGRSNYACLAKYNERLEEYEQTGDVSFRTQEAARQFVEQIIPWMKETARGDIEDAPFTFLPAAKGDLTATRDQCAGKACRFVGECYANKALAAGARANVVVTNTRLAMEHARIYNMTQGHAGVIPLGIVPRKDEEEDEPEPFIDETAKPIWYLDEAHQLSSIARATLQKELTRGRFSHLVSGIERLTTGHKTVRTASRGQLAMPEGGNGPDPEQILRTAETWHERAERLSGATDQAFAQWQERMIRAKVSTAKLGDEAAICEPLLEALDEIRKLLKSSMPSWLENEKTDEAMWARLVKQAAELQHDLAVIADPGDPDVTIRYAELEEDEETERKFVTLIAAPISVAEPLRNMLWGTYPHVVAVSATLAGPDGLDHWRRQVGGPETEELIVPAPFNYPRQALLYLPSDSKRFDPRGDARNLNTRRGRDYLEAYVDCCEQLVRASGGGALLLFTSNTALNAAYKGASAITVGDDDLPTVVGLADRLGNDFTLIRQDAYSSKEATRILKEDGNAVLFGVKTFAEGVDVPGQALRLVVINSFLFPPPDDPVWSAMCDAVDRQVGENMAWFRQLAVPEATIALKQAVGRLIRRGNDTGVMAVLDGRASGLTKYGRDIVRALPPATQTRSLDDVRAFYRKERVGQ